MGVSRRVPGAPVLALAVADGLVVTDFPRDLGGYESDAHATPPCCSSQPAAKFTGPALNGDSQAREMFL